MEMELFGGWMDELNRYVWYGDNRRDLVEVLCF